MPTDMTHPTRESTSGSTTDPATDAGTTAPAGADITDDELAREVAGETSPDLKVEDAFSRERDGSVTDEPIDKADADDLTQG